MGPGTLSGALDVLKNAEQIQSIIVLHFHEEFQGILKLKEAR